VSSCSRGARALGRSILAAAAALGPAGSAGAKPAAAIVLPPLPILPSVARVKVTSHGDAIAVVEEVNLPRGEWKGMPLSFHVAFGAPGPRAIDAHLVAVPDGALEPEDVDPGEPLAVERVPRRPPGAYGLLGRETMAGIVVHLRPDAFTRALARGNMAALRVRSLFDAPDPDPAAAASVVVRLGASRGTPLTLGRIVVDAAPPAAPPARVEARLCGPEADPQPLAVRAPSTSGGRREPGIAPVLAVRHASDDLCIRLWRAQPPR
jgi:hypothetical protein